ncbi:GTP-binding protein-like protein 2 [Rhexocercosporidium sp. MPI-PUGE-AT-0058]|nr:GTP-binding protein-like protein 2 [Rhexocercosporidium sp. MPI-PUGE-AT-0058]
MASIFTYETEPSRVSSPWLTPTDSPKPSTPQPTDQVMSTIASPSSARLADHGVTRLEAEPQDGPTEYKLHLLLRPRRNYSRSSTGTLTSGSHRKSHTSHQPASNDSGPVLGPSSQSRQNRFEQLTTQLLWRLQQSSPYHDVSTSELVLPKLPDATNSLETPSKPAKLLAGLEQSRGALYEIGVSDDGTFVGLTEDEMNESLTNLRAMAASLGCNVEIVRMVVVGECEWLEHPSTSASQGFMQQDQNTAGRPPVLDARSGILRHEAQLWVAEALVSPNLGPRRTSQNHESNHATTTWHETTSMVNLNSKASLIPDTDRDDTEQLRITLTGPTTSGKSSLLGTLSTATLDNGRGKSRLSLLKHRHEIASGVTSSVAQELIGYQGRNVINYASGNVTSWTDIHFSSRNGRLVFVSDSAGHWRYRRTIVRGLIGWAPHWTILCIGADEGDAGAGGRVSPHETSAAEFGVDLGKAHLELCLKLDRPLAVVITKLDLASKASLRQALSKILSVIKVTGRIPSIIPPDQAKTVEEADLGIVPEKNDKDPIRELVEKMHQAGDLTSIIPILMTSAARGTGVRSMHALLQNLPIPPNPTAQDLVGPVLNPEQPACLFHIEDVFGFPASLEPLASNTDKTQDTGVVVAGHLRFGTFSVGDKVVVGPFPAESDEIDSAFKPFSTRPPTKLGPSLSQSSTAELSPIASRSAISASVTKGEWFNAHIVSLRNLRLPVHTLQAGQVGTVGIVLDIPKEEVSSGPFERPPPQPPRVRKGLVMAIPSRHMLKTGHTLQAASGFTASFEDSDINSVTPGSLVVVYVASIRAAARVLRVVPHANNDLGASTEEEEPTDVFGLGAILKVDEQEPESFVFGIDGILDVTFELLTSREWIELGSQVLVMPGGGHGLYYGSERGEKGVAGLDGFAGRVVEIVD